MDESVKLNRWIWQYPMKPVRINENVFRNLRLADYLMERKFDGFRVLAISGSEGVKLWTRHKRVLKTPPSLLKELNLKRMPVGTVLDGEIWSDKKRGGWETKDDKECRVTFWDCLSEGHRLLGKSPIEERRDAMRSILGNGCDRVQIVEALDATVENLHKIQNEASKVRFQDETRSGFIHGAVLKRRGSRRHDHPKRSAEDASWLKVVFDGLKGWEPR
jgi:ATP-dependent DNA ligase